MPAFTTHYLFAHGLLDRIQEADPSIELNPDAVYYGAQGPDALFFHRLLPTMPGKSVSKAGFKMHELNPNKILNPMLVYLRDMKNRKGVTPSYYDALSYVYGFICHYALDRTTHPYVYSMQDEIVRQKKIKYNSGTIHNKIEYAIDMNMLDSEAGIKDGRKFEARDVLSQDNSLKYTIAGVLAYAATESTGVKVTRDNAIQTLADMRSIQSILTDRKGWKTPVLNCIEPLIYPFVGPYVTTQMRHAEPWTDWDYMNESHTPWAYVAKPSIVRTESFRELYNLAKDDAIALIKAFKEALADDDMTMDEATGGISFENGLEVK